MEPPTKEKKTAEELAVMIREDLARWTAALSAE
jgi:hypothetical protein